MDTSFENQGMTTLGAVCECVLGGTPSRAKTEFWNGDIPWINSGEVNKFRITQPSEYITKLGLDKSATKLLPAHTTVIAITGATLGQISLLEIASCTNQSVVGVLENDDVPFEFIYPFICQNIDVLLSHQTGGAQQHINKQNVEQLPLVLPIKSVLSDYKTKVEPFFKMIAKNCFENERLVEIRDALLPKLMSGEIDVSKVDISDPGCLDKSLFILISDACAGRFFDLLPFAQIYVGCGGVTTSDDRLNCHHLSCGLLPLIHVLSDRRQNTA